MNLPEHLEISINTVFQLFGKQEAQTLTHPGIMELLSFVFIEFGITRPVEQADLEEFLRQHQLQNQVQITKEHFGGLQFLNFNRESNKNCPFSEVCELKIPIQPLFKEMESAGCQIIERQKVRQFLAGMYSVLQIPKAVEDEDVTRFISDFDGNRDGQLQTSDLQGIECLKFTIIKCRRYQ